MNINNAAATWLLHLKQLIMERYKTQEEIDNHIEKHKLSLKNFEKSYGFKKQSITLPKFMWERMLSELLTSSVFCGRLSDQTGYGFDKDEIEWNTELMMAIEALEKKVRK